MFFFFFFLSYLHREQKIEACEVTTVYSCYNSEVTTENNII